MNFSNQLELAVWRELSIPKKWTLIQELFQSSMVRGFKINEVELKYFEMCGMKCQTFEFQLDQKKFVFIPGNSQALLGWELGPEGLQTRDLFPSDSFFNHSKERYKILVTQEEINEINPEKFEEFSLFDFQTLEGISEYINTFTTPVRVCQIPPMFVQKRAEPVGTQRVGTYHCVTGVFQTQHSDLTYYKDKIRALMSPAITLEESFNWEFPKEILVADQFYLSQMNTSNAYRIYEQKNQNYLEVSDSLAREGYDLLSEDEWEYSCGGGTRRLFRWGNEILLDKYSGIHSASQKVTLSNMFGLFFDSTQQRFELTTDIQKAKLSKSILGREGSTIQKILPLSTYYTPFHEINETQVLDPREYLYRRTIKFL